MDQENKSLNVNIAFIDKGKLAERQGRKAEGLRCVSMMTVWLPRGLHMEPALFMGQVFYMVQKIKALPAQQKKREFGGSILMPE